MMTDILRINNMVFNGYVGQEDFEREVGQRLEVDVELYLDLSTAGQTDNIANTIDVRMVYHYIEEIMVEAEGRLIEGIAEKIAGTLIEKLHVPEVVIRVRKPNASIGGVCDGFEVEISRTA